LSIGEPRAAQRLTDPAYVRHQYADDDFLRVRIETHRRYSENRASFTDWVLARLAATAGDRVLDVGSGPGDYHAGLARARLVAIDLSAGMLAKVSVPRAQADAQALPFRDASFARVLCAHVLFHVPDIPRALREMRRVLMPRGRAVIVTNSRATMRPLFEMQNAIALELGIAEESSVAARFGLEDVDVVREVFPTARVDVYEDAFRFAAAEPVLAYVSSTFVGLLPADTRAEYLGRLARRVEAVIAREGVFRVPKRSGCFVADV